MKIRVATSEDVPAIVALVNLAFGRAEAFLVYGDRTNAPEIAARFQTGMFLLAEEAGTLMGCVYLELRGERAYFGLLSVDPARQGRGIARTLVDEVERRARDAGSRIMDILTVNVRTELIPMYLRMGYAESGTEPFPANVPTKMPCHFVRMSKNLA
jgi:N-acetylglutamate synthase-like GNAT family acetyltransferase